MSSTSIPLGDGAAFERRATAVRRLRLAFAAVAVAAMFAFLISSFRQPAEPGVVAARLVQRGRRARRLGEHLVRHVRAHRRHARPARPLERLLRADPVLRYRVSGAAAEHAGAGAEAAASVLRRPQRRRLRGRCRGAAQSVDGCVRRRHPHLDGALARARRDPEGAADAPGGSPRQRSRRRQRRRRPRQPGGDRLSARGYPAARRRPQCGSGGRGVHPPVPDLEGVVRAGGAPVRAGEWLLRQRRSLPSSRWRCSPLSASAAFCSWPSLCAGGQRERLADRPRRRRTRARRRCADAGARHPLLAWGCRPG